MSDENRRSQDLWQLLRLLTSLLCSPLLLPVLLYLYLSLNGTIRSWSWIDSSCRILESTLTPTATNPDFFQLDARIQHTNGVIVNSTAVLSREFNKRALNQDSARARLALYSAGTTTRCFVNPVAPHEVLLDRSPEKEFSIIALTLLIIPIIPLLVGPQVRAMWRYSRGLYARELYAPLHQCITESTTPRRRVVHAMVAASWAVIALVGTVRYFEYRADVLASDWRKRSCEVRFRPQSFYPSNSEMDFVYSYSIDGTEFRSNHIAPFGVGMLSSTDRAMIEALNLGDSVACYVSPSRPVFARLTALVPLSLRSRLAPLLWLSLAGILITWLSDFLMRRKERC